MTSLSQKGAIFGSSLVENGSGYQILGCSQMSFYPVHFDIRDSETQNKKKKEIMKTLRENRKRVQKVRRNSSFTRIFPEIWV